jgi:polysaccharide export outer membrane protein
MKRVKKLISLALIFCIVFLPVSNVTLAQVEENKETPKEIPKETHQNGSLNYYLAPGADNQLLIKVNIWGEVLKPGTVQVPDDTDLLSLLSVVGGPTENAKLSQVRIVRNFSQPKTLIVNVKDCIKKGKAEDIPQIKPGDTVIVPRNSFPSVTKWVAFIYNLAVIASVIKIFTQ